MGLNDDLPQTIDPDLIPEPGSLNRQEGDLELVANSRVAPDPEKGIPPEIIQDLPNLNISFRSITDAGERLVNLEEVEEQILGEEGMSRASAETIERVMGNFYEQVGDASKFTQTPSGVGMESTVNFIQNIRVETKRSMALEFQSFLEKPIARAIEDLALVKEKFEPYCRATCEQLRADMRSANRPFYESDNVIFSIDVKTTDGVESKFVNIFTEDIDLLSKMLDEADCVDLVPYMASLKATKAILDNTKLKDFIKCFNDTRDFAKSISPTATAAYRDQPFSLKDLVTFFGSEDCCEAVNNFVQIVEAKLARFQEIRDEAVPHMENGTMDKFVTLRTAEISDFLKYVSHFFMYTNEYLLLLNQVKSLFDISQQTIEPTQPAV